MARPPSTLFGRIRRGATGAVAALLVATPASATFIGVTDDRRIFVNCVPDGYQPPGDRAPCGGLVSGNAEARPSAPFAFFDQSVSVASYSASQTSSFGSDLLEGRGSIDIIGGPVESGSAWSTFSITFDVDVATPFSLSGVLQRHAFAQGGHYSISLTELTLGTQIFARIDQDDGGLPLPFATSGVLAPGSYRMLVSWDLDRYHGGNPYGSPSSYQFQLAAIPEPSAAMLLATGILALAAGRRRS